ncbi:MAG: SDR family NAD(P)-dependent oxidoreductase [Prevotellaceae bacterium]|jgi:short-subunit dehydrogenase|nr:SDR family NAD(P)-dependent oxidoreductase [Prevotellaceae bacterium]
MRFHNKKIVITGATSGIGLELIKQLQPFHPEIIAVGRAIEKIPAIPRVYPFAADISTQKGVDSVFDFALEKFGNIDIFIANAGFGYYEKIKSPDWEHAGRIFSTNVLSPIFGLEKMLEICKEREFTYAVTDSGLGRVYMPGYALYCGTKYALHGFVSSMQYELPANAHLCTIYPVAMETEFFNRAGGKKMPRPFPTQKVTTAVRNMLKDLQKEKQSSYPYRPLRFLIWLSNVFPFLLKTNNRMETKKLNKFIDD